MICTMQNMQGHSTGSKIDCRWLWMKNDARFTKATTEKKKIMGKNV